ncbi:MAG TPA: 3-methyl-2-oxobutanoate dehydrogenase subunit VorB [Candidatus Edwardsbacteria bacterium]|nr:3-methyl-2-oxobutanoate dehydrogenase subunit VorB [Candidatus Edwardsbacteria bacterium]
MGEKILMKGNEALAEGAIRAGCRFFAGYPITPQNEVPEYMSWRLPDSGGTFIQAESEVAAINMIYGAAATGIRAMTSSSSPGISLKQEGISYCAGADLPFFYANVVRGGPGLGNIAAAQGDYNQSTRGGGHGDYRVFVMAPNSVDEMANFPKRCYEVAEKYRVPSMVLADGILGQMMEPVEFAFEPVDPAKLAPKDWELGVNNGRAKRVVKSYDLREGELEKLNVKRMARYKKIEQDEVLFEAKQCGDADLVIVAYGTSSRIAASAMKMARDKGMKVGLFRPITLWPFPKKALADLAAKAKKFLVVEMSMGQFVDDVRLAVCGKVEVDLYARPAGIPSGEEVFAVVEKTYRGIAAASKPAAKGQKQAARRGRPKGSKNKAAKKPVKRGRPAKPGKGGRR